MGGDAAALGVALDEMRRELAAGEGSLQAAHAHTHSMCMRMRIYVCARACACACALHEAYAPLTTCSVLTTNHSPPQAAYAQMDKLKLAAKAEMARQRAQMAQQHSLVVAKLRGQPAGTGGETPQPRAAVTPPTGLRQATHGDTTDGGADVSAARLDPDPCRSFP